MSPVVMRIAGLAAGGTTPADGRYLVEYDPDRRGVDPAGEELVAHVVLTDDPAQALAFESVGEALALWRKVSTRWPVRPGDGRLNRPLTAYSVEMVKR